MVVSWHCRRAQNRFGRRRVDEEDERVEVVRRCLDRGDQPLGAVAEPADGVGGLEPLALDGVVVDLLARGRPPVAQRCTRPWWATRRRTSQSGVVGTGAPSPAVVAWVAKASSASRIPSR